MVMARSNFSNSCIKSNPQPIETLTEFPLASIDFHRSLKYLTPITSKPFQETLSLR